MEIPEHKKLGTQRDLASTLAKYLLAGRYHFKNTLINDESKTATVKFMINTDIKRGNLYPSNLSFSALEQLLCGFTAVEFDKQPPLAAEGLGNFPISRTYNLLFLEAEAMPDGEQGEFLKQYFLWQLSLNICKKLDYLTQKKMWRKFKDPREQSKAKKLVNTLKNSKHLFSKKKYNRYRN